MQFVACFDQARDCNIIVQGCRLVAFYFGLADTQYTETMHSCFLLLFLFSYSKEGITAATPSTLLRQYGAPFEKRKCQWLCLGRPAISVALQQRIVYVFWSRFRTLEEPFYI
jgi:hypothetical protein